MHDFTELRIWIKSIDLAERIYLFIDSFPKKETFGITNQMRKCSVSISSNIAEGCGRNSKNEFIQFLSIANGSTSELHSQVILSRRLRFISDEEEKLIIENSLEIKNMNLKLQESIKKSK
jgi:four helix bundle protein